MVLTPPVADGGGGSVSGSGYSYSVSGYCDNPYRDGKYIKVVVHASGSSTYSGTLYINGSAVGSSWANVNGGSTSGQRTLSFESPGPFTSRSVEVRCKGQDRKGGGNFDTFCYPTTGSWDEAMSINLTLDANGGTVDPATGQVAYGETYGELPTPTLRGKKFSGWFTERDGGTQITEDTEVTVTEDQTLYAHWDAGFAGAYVAEAGEVKSVAEAYIVKDGNVSSVTEAYVVENGTPHSL